MESFLSSLKKLLKESLGSAIVLRILIFADDDAAALSFLLSHSNSSFVR